MRNVLILGSGRSGTSMVAGVLARAGYFMGDALWTGRAGNPRGFFEDREVNQVNEDVLALVVPKRPRILGKWFFRDRPVNLQRWLAHVAPGVPVTAPDAIAKRIARLTRRAPWCFKDPRFCYTLPAWRPHIGDAAFVAVFRHPTATVASILKECREAPYLRNLAIDFDRAMAGWVLMYRHVLEVHRRTGDWHFLHYEQAFQPAAMDRLQAFLGASVDRDFPEQSLRRPAQAGDAPAEALRIYRQLCELAAHEDSRSSFL